MTVFIPAVTRDKEGMCFEKGLEGFRKWETSNSKRKRNVLNIETKLEILNRLAKGESGASLAQFYNVGKSTISDINKSRGSSLNFASKLGLEDGSKKRKTMREANDVALNRALYLWFSQN
ncbi:jerky-like protein [Trichonephila clavipes]|nr:jerky-like protein [Trichonephila clavipes]